ncbi:DUF6603 domain-containing protein [Streptomyces celluloflavus]
MGDAARADEDSAMEGQPPEQWPAVLLDAAGVADMVPRLTGAQLRLEVPGSGQGVGLGMDLEGSAAGRKWSVGVASAAASGAGAGKRVTLVTAAALPGVGLKDLPLVGSRIPANVGELSGLALMARSKATTQEVATNWAELQRLTAEAGDGLVLTPSQKVVQEASAALGVAVGLGGSGGPVQVWVSLVKNSKKHAAHIDASTPVVVPAGLVYFDGGSPGPALWVQVGKALGPLRVHRVGVVVSTGARTSVGLLADASFRAGPVEFDTTGLGLVLSWKAEGDFSVAGTLDGLGFAYTAGPVQASAAFARAPKPPDGTRLMVAGAVKVTTPVVNFTAVGMYAELTAGGTSAFVIGRVSGLEVPLGPAVLTGLTGGFGYNSELVLPSSPREVAGHPLLSADLPAGKDPLQALTFLGNHVRPHEGAVWAAAGATFQLFKLIDVTAVLALQVEPGDVTVVLLAEASVRFPQQGTAYAQLVLDVMASYRSSTGAIAVLGSLDPSRCYLVHPSCHLQGGFALCTWVPPSSHCGDFVVTLGGYHPDYRRPSHYPEVERLGLNWSADPVQITGECYAAVTPSMVTLGGRLVASCSTSWASAELEAHLNVVVTWEPFSYLIDLGLTARVSVPSLGLNLHPGLTLTLWGPPMGGKATVSLPIVPDITVRFGPGRPDREAVLTWDQFYERILDKRPLQVQVTSGLLPRPETSTKGPDADKDELWVSANGFTLVLSTPLPCSRLELATTTSSRVVTSGATVNIRPMGKSSGKNVTSTCTVKIEQGGKKVDAPRMTPAAVNSAVPSSAFGTPLDHDTNPAANGGEELVPGAVTGLTMPFITEAEGALPSFDEKNLDNEKAGEGTMPPLKQTLIPAAKPGSRDSVYQALAPASAPTRNDVVHAWARYGLAPQGAVVEPTEFRRRLWSMTGADPLTISS